MSVVLAEEEGMPNGFLRRRPEGLKAPLNVQGLLEEHTKTGHKYMEMQNEKAKCLSPGSPATTSLETDKVELFRFSS